MKKILLISGVVIIGILIAAVVVIGLTLDAGIKKGVETVGPMLTKTPVKLDSVSLSILSGGGKVSGLAIGNPEGYKSPNAILVGSASLAVKPGSLLSDKIVVKSINVQGPEITFETDLKGNNLSKLLANIEASTGGPAKDTPVEKQTEAGKKLQVDEFIVSGGRVHASLSVMGGQSVTIPLPEIRLTALGTGPEGITAADLSKRVLTEIIQAAVKAGSGAATDLLKNGTALTKDLDKATSGATEKASKAVGDLFKKK